MSDTLAMKPEMNARIVKFFLCSLCLHLTLLPLFWKTGAFHYGAAPGVKSANRILTVRLVANDKRPQRPIPIDSPPPTHKPARRPAAGNEASAAISAAVSAEPGVKTESAASQEYFAPGELTRLPVPLADIDLNAAEISETGFAGKAELAVLIDMYGNVADVITVSEVDNATMFLAKVAARFKRARFSPGEINGKAVNSQLRITVVSESLAALDGQRPAP